MEKQKDYEIEATLQGLGEGVAIGAGGEIMGHRRNW